MSRSVEWKYLLGSLELEAGLRTRQLAADGEEEGDFTREDTLALALRMRESRRVGGSLPPSVTEDAGRVEARAAGEDRAARDPDSRMNR